MDLLKTDYLATLALPPIGPPVGLHHRARFGRDYDVRLDTVDDSVDPRAGSSRSPRRGTRW